MSTWEQEHSHGMSWYRGNPCEEPGNVLNEYSSALEDRHKKLE